MTLLVCEKLEEWIADNTYHSATSVGNFMGEREPLWTFIAPDELLNAIRKGTFTAQADGGLAEALRIARQWIHNGEAPIGWSLDRIDEVLNGARPSHSGCVANEDRIQYCAHGVPYAVPCNECFPLPTSPEVKP